MHSVVVLGDVRCHIVELDQGDWEEVETASLDATNDPESQTDSTLIPGGAYMMGNAIKQMAKECSIWLKTSRESGDPIRDVDLERIEQVVYSYVTPVEALEVGHIGHFNPLLQWKLVPKEVAGAKNKMARLTGKAKRRSKPEIPTFTENLRSALSGAQHDACSIDKGYFPAEAWFDQSLRTSTKEIEDGHARSCPDVVVLDDLNVGFSKIEFARNLNPRVHSDATANHRSRIEKNDGGEAQLSSALSLLFDRFYIAREASLNDNKSILEPVIVGSLSDSPGRIFANRREEDGPEVDPSPDAKKNTWLHLYDDPWLRRRVVILLDAEDLRADNLQISTGLSWERTAQDTISQMRHSETYRQFLHFGHVIVRYGVTGALHIENNFNENNRTYTLFFDPKHDDTHWSHRSLNDSRGVVLGDTAIYVAHVVKAIQQECRRHKGYPELMRLGAIVQRGISGAIKSCQLQSRTSYGDGECSSFLKAATRKVSDEPYYFPKGTFCTGRGTKSDGGWEVDGSKLSKKDITVVSASIPPSLQRQWSILMQSALVGDMEGLATRIVKHGASHVFNRGLNDSYFRSREALIQRIIDVSYEEEHRLQDDKGKFIDRRIKDEWLGICCKAVERFNEMQELVGTLDRELYLQKPDVMLELHSRALGAEEEWDEDQFFWNLLRPEAKTLTRGELWRHLNNPDKDNCFEQIFLKRDSTVEENPESDVERPIGYVRSREPDPIVAPVVEYGKERSPVFVIDRQEVEGYRAIERLIVQHLDAIEKSGSTPRPLCIALFGPPGAGKSFAVKSVRNRLPDRENIRIELIDPAYNLGQYTKVDNLNDAFEGIAATMNSGKGKEKVVPIAFFDEFDSHFGDEELGWLKFFLAPMEDGFFGTHQVHNAILVFAGGTRRSFNEFSLADRPKNDQQWIDFSKAKGPDFASRLSGHLDIVGINSTGTEDELFMIRRSLFMRGTLSQHQKLTEGMEASIDDLLIRAMLKAPDFRNGGRSIRKMLELCRDHSGHISTSEIPPIHQLNMHVDGKAFLDLLHEPKRHRG